MASSVTMHVGQFVAAVLFVTACLAVKDNKNDNEMASPQRTPSYHETERAVSHSHDGSAPVGDSYGTFSPAANHTKDGEHVPLVDKSESWCEKYTSCRWTLAYMGGWANLLMFCLRNCISMAIVCMSDIQEQTDVIPDACDGNNSFCNLTDNDVQNGSSGKTVAMEYIPQSIQGVVLSAYYYGYILTPFLGGVIAIKLGFKHVLSVSIALSAVLTLLMPESIRFHIYLTIILRTLLGFVAGVTLPSLTMMWTHWAPPNEKGKLLTITLSGSSTGSIVANLVSGFLCLIPLDEGWPFIFYTYGAIAALWVVLWQFLAYETPDKHPRVSHKERAVIGWKTKPPSSTKVTMKPPLKAIFTSPPFYAMVLAHMSDSWFINFTSTYLPLYLNGFLGFDTEASGVLSSLPFISRVLMNLLFAVLADRIHMHRLLSPTWNRKLFQTLGSVVAGAMLIGVGFLDPSQRYVSVVILVILSGVQSAGQLGFRLTPLDIAPRFAGPLTGLSVTFGTAAHITCPLVTSAISADNKPESWAKVFIITGCISFAGALSFLLFGTAEEQEWAKERKPLYSCHGRDDFISGDATSGFAVPRPETSGFGGSTDILIEDETTGKEKTYTSYKENYPELLTSGEY